MKKTVICSMPMKKRKDLGLVKYASDDESIPVSDRAVRYPINTFLEAALDDGTELKVILLVKKAENSAGPSNVEDFKKELEEAVAGRNISVEYVVITTEFSQKQAVHEKLMGEIVDQIEDGTAVFADITYGPKDLPIIIFSVLNFAEKFLNCEIEHILYGQAEFENGKVVNTKICDMAPLFYLGSVTNLIHAPNSQKARQMLKSLLEL